MNVRTVFAGWLTLIGLYTALTRSDAVAAALGTTTQATKRLSDPGVALIPNRAAKTKSTTTTTTGGYQVSPGTGQPPPSTIYV